MLPLVFDLATTLSDAGSQVVTYVGGAIGVGLGVGVLMWGGRTAWRAVKSFGK